MPYSKVHLRKKCLNCRYDGSGYLHEDKYREREFDNISLVIESVTPFAYKCITYFSDLSVIRHLILANKSFAFSVFLMF